MPKSRTTTKEVALQVRVPKQLAELFKQAASRDNRTFSGWARDRLEKIAKAELAE